MTTLTNLNALMLQAINNLDHEQVAQIRQQQVAEFNQAIDISDQRDHEQVKSEFIKLDHEYFEYCETQFPLPGRVCKNSFGVTI